MTEWLHFHFSLCIGEGNGNPLQCSCLENPRDGGAWLAAIYGVAQSRTRLKWLSSSSRLVITFLPRSKRLLISWLQEPPSNSLSLFPLFPHLFAMKWWDQMPWSLFFEYFELRYFSIIFAEFSSTPFLKVWKVWVSHFWKGLCLDTFSFKPLLSSKVTPFWLSHVKHPAYADNIHTFIQL